MIRPHTVAVARILLKQKRCRRSNSLTKTHQTPVNQTPRPSVGEGLALPGRCVLPQNVRRAPDHPPSIRALAYFFATFTEARVVSQSIRMVHDASPPPWSN